MPSDLQVYLLIGKEDFLKREFLAELRRRLFSDGSGNANVQEFTAREEPLGAVFDFVLTAPFLSEKRLAVLWKVEALSREEQKALLSALDGLLPSSELVLISEETSVKKNDFLKVLSARAKLVACHPPFERDLPQWIERRAQKAGTRFEKAALRVLMERAGKEIPALDSAVEQLAVYVDPRKIVTAADVQNLLGRSLQEDIFSLVDFLLEKKTAAALETLENLLRDGTGASEILAVLAGQWTRLAAYFELERQGRTAAEIAGGLKIHPFYQEKFFSQAAKTSREEVESSLRRLLNCDEAIKTGRRSDRLAIEGFILETAGPSANGS